MFGKRPLVGKKRKERKKAGPHPLTGGSSNWLIGKEKKKKNYAGDGVDALDFCFFLTTDFPHPLGRAELCRSKLLYTFHLEWAENDDANPQKRLGNKQAALCSLVLCWLHSNSV